MAAGTFPHQFCHAKGERKPAAALAAACWPEGGWQSLQELCLFEFEACLSIVVSPSTHLWGAPCAASADPRVSALSAADADPVADVGL